MRAWAFAAGAAAAMMTHGMSAAATVETPVGLGSSADTGGVHSVAARPGTHLIANFRLRIEAASLVPQKLGTTLDPMPKPKRVASMLDYYPDSDSGLRFSAGMRMLSRKGRSSWTPYKASKVGSRLYAPAMTTALPDHANIAKTAPAMTMGWTTALSRNAAFGIEAGSMFEHGGGHITGASIAQPRLAGASWSRVDPVAQVAFAMRF